MEIDGTGVDVNQQTPNTEVQNPTEGQTVKQEDYKALQSEYTKARQALIETNTEAVRANPDFIHKISDEKVQSAILHNLYGVDSLDEYEAVKGNDNEVDDDKLKAKIASKKSDDMAEKMAIMEFRIANQSITEARLEEIKEQARVFDKSIPMNERLSLAMKLTSKPKEAYKDTQITVGSSTS